jgi:glutathione peroxidase
MSVTLALLAALAALAAAVSGQPQTPTAPPAQPSAPAAPAAPATGDPDVLKHTVRTIDGKEADLSQYRGKVVIIVNVASKCGFTPQYEGLEALYKARQKDGLVILAFPANNFGAQEPGTSEQIARFCADTYHVTFPIFEKISVKGPDQHALYRQLTSQPPPIGGDPKWNFTKFVVDRSGRVVARYDADRKYIRTATLEPELERKVDELLAQAPPKG